MPRYNILVIKMTFRVCHDMSIPSSRITGSGGTFNLSPHPDGGYLIPTTVPIGQYRSGRTMVGTRLYSRVTYFIGFSPEQCGGLIHSKYLTRNSAATHAVKRNGNYTLINQGWSNGLNDDATCERVYDFVERVLSIKSRRDPVRACRILLTHCCQGNYSNELVIGVWNEMAKGKTFAHSFPEVMRNYANGVSNFGQCFVFSATVLALMRHIGLQTRQVCSTRAGHNSDRSHFIEFINETRGNRRRDGFDTTWNFHCWDEVFLPNKLGVGEWHVIDATPQETSLREPGRGMFTCGPCSIPCLQTLVHANRWDYDFPYCSAGTQGFGAYGVEHVASGRTINLHYHIWPNATGATLMIEQATGGFKDEKERYRPDRPAEPKSAQYTITPVRTGRNVEITFQGTVPPGIQTYVVMIRSNKPRSKTPNPKSGDPYRVLRPRNNRFTIPSNWSHCYVVTGIPSKRPPRGNRFLLYRASAKVQLPSASFSSSRVVTAAPAAEPSTFDSFFSFF